MMTQITPEALHLSTVVAKRAAMMRILMPRAMATFFPLVLFPLSCTYLLVNVEIDPRPCGNTLSPLGAKSIVTDL